MNQPAIIIEDVSVGLGGRSVLENLNVTIEKGVLTAIVGPNGAGKTTLLHAILGLVPFRGRVRFFDRKGGGKPRIGFIPQKLNLDRGSPVTVRDFLATGITARPLWSGIIKKTDDSCGAMLDRVGAYSVFRSPIGKISGGELQRVLLAQALLGDPEILLLDEPAAAVDIAGEALFCDILDDVQKDMGITTLLVSHDLSIVTTHARNVLCLNRRLICAGPRTEVLTPDNLKKLFSPHINIFIHNHGHAASVDKDSSGIAG